MLNIDLMIDHSTWIGKTVPPQLASLSSSLSFNLIELLLHVADATKNPNYLGRSLNDFWAFLRYSRCFEASGNLRLVREFNDIDAHQKTILSDDIGMGISSLVMDRTFGVKALTDTSFFLKYLTSLSTISTGKKGPNKSPDFLVLDSRSDIHILECKGTQNGISNSDAQIEKGKSQKRSLQDPNSIISEKLVMGTFIAKSTGINNSRLKIIDPDFKYDFSKLTKEEMKYLLLFSQLIKELSFVENENYLTFFPKEVLPQNILEGKEYFEKFKSNFLDNQLTRRNFRDAEKYRDIEIEKVYNFDFVKDNLIQSRDLKMFLDNFIEEERKIDEGRYKGVFGLELVISGI
ncbi:hypothetical protein [Lysinibacillus sp. BPa_S21]|uniref:hypothetical protein n=1 Tax=Lysinibacillus sp. BPa_S21 TaxID=2932478 RepID=UPI002011D4F8|nr:hypothetical protein [Lysinibacillus sp. BPa_S21]MCL1697346.1 hypothetical protein [Lysinibacillus sp. BPa_S21]